MIRLEVQDYCDNCVEFEPEMEKPEPLYLDGVSYPRGDTVIRCKYRNRCEQIKAYLESKNQE